MTPQPEALPALQDCRQVLAEEMEERRRELSLTQREVWRRGGPSDSTQADLENARFDLILPSTFRRVDKGLGWEPGTAASLFHTGKRPGRPGGPQQGVPQGHAGSGAVPDGEPRLDGGRAPARRRVHDAAGQG